MDTLASNGVFFLLLDAFTWRADSHVAKLRKAKLLQMQALRVLYVFRGSTKKLWSRLCMAARLV